MEFSDLLRKESIEPNTVLVLRHRPSEPDLWKVFPWLAAERPDLFNAYQQIQSLSVEKSMKKADYVASFIGNEAGHAVFIQLYRRGDWHPKTYDEYWEMQTSKELKEFGHGGFAGERETIDWFDLDETDFYAEWKGRLVVKWPPLDRAWRRWADRNQFLIHAIHEHSILNPPVTEWDKLDLTWDQLKVLPSNLKSALREWRGIYYIFDADNCLGYVGSACGKENLLGRWQNYAKSGHGDNKLLRRRDPKNFRFSILQRVSPDMEQGEVNFLEATWKDRLHTREFGLNAN
jgi:hypothetical protein